jgi:hypothetical protein
LDFFCFLGFLVLCAVVVGAVVVGVAVVVAVVVVAHGPIVSPCCLCAGHALTLIVIVTKGLVFECVW